MAVQILILYILVDFRDSSLSLDRYILDFCFAWHDYIVVQNRESK
jgi:hypothetical protein